MFNGARILVAPLDWGLGHAARCVPIIQRLLDHDATPILGADGGPLGLLGMEFPQLEHVRIPGMDVRYSKSSSQLWSMAQQFPAMVRSVQAERAAFDRLRHQLRLDAVISDQRFGIRSAELPSVIITHQVFPFTPLVQAALRKVNLHHIARFDRCWVMDEPKAPGLAGELSHGRSLPANARYIGTVSRMASPKATVKKRYGVAAVISGPEPQRTLLEQLLIDQLRSMEGEHLLVLGQPNSAREARIGNLTIRSHLSGLELTKALLASDLIVSRSGYTTLMDLAAIGRSALIVPTPGQAEQEYLAELHARTGRFMVQHQDKLDVSAAMARSTALVAPPLAPHTPLLEQALKDLVGLLR
ncbi:MAG: glycosyl transferase family 28 [Flavobacteriales bacterium]|nr:glycosyl transferase family 28 [Flavobacteriales bacterium]